MTNKLAPEQVVRFKLDGGKKVEFKLNHLRVAPGRKVSLKRDFDPTFTGGFKSKQEAEAKLSENILRLTEMQDRLYAQDRYAVLILFQAMDAAGKDGAIKHVMSGLNPQGCQVTSFKVPSAEELDHDYLWRAAKALPRRGMLGIFNRSYYEEVLVVRVHPEFLDRQRLPAQSQGKHIWKRRFEEINAFERYLVENGVCVVKFFLNLSKGEQRRRFLARIEEPDKNWKFSTADFQERAHWDEYQAAYQDCFRHTSTEIAPWFIIPADHKWFTRLAVSEILVRVIEGLDLKYPRVSPERRRELQHIRTLLEREKK